MDDMGMSDLQFKSFLKQLVKRTEDARAEEVKRKIDEIIQDLKTTSRSRRGTPGETLSWILGRGLNRTVHHARSAVPRGHVVRHPFAFQPTRL